MHCPVAEIRLEGVSLVHADGTLALDGVDLTVADGELLALIGPSGAGKTTLLRVVVGLERPTSGRVWIGGRVVDHLSPAERNLGHVPQEGSLIPTRTVAGQLSFPLELRDLPRGEIAKRIRAEGNVLGILGLFHRRPHELSAGEAQKVAVGRARTRVPDALLLDEPLALVDAHQRQRLRRELRTYQQAGALTVVLATNDHDEALAIADRVAVLHEGRVQQVGTPEAVLTRPVSAWVAAFVGEQPMALADGHVEDDGGVGHVVVAGQRLRMPGGLPGPLRDRVGVRLRFGARPHQVRAVEPGDPADARLVATVRRSVLLPHVQLVHLDTEGGEWVARFPTDVRRRPGERVEVTVDVRGLTAFDAGSGSAVWHGGAV